MPGACPVGLHGGEQTPGEGRQGDCRQRRNNPEDCAGNEQQSEGCQLGVVAEHLQHRAEGIAQGGGEIHLVGVVEVTAAVEVGQNHVDSDDRPEHAPDHDHGGFGDGGGARPGGVELLHAGAHGGGGSCGEARHQNVNGGAKPTGADKDDKADSCDGDAHIFFDEGNGQGPPAGVGEVAGTFGAAHTRGEHQVAEAHGKQRHGEGDLVELGCDCLLNAEAEGESGAEEQTRNGRDNALILYGLGVLSGFSGTGRSELSFLGEREGTLSKAHNGEACEGDHGVLHHQQSGRRGEQCVDGSQERQNRMEVVTPEVKVGPLNRHDRHGEVRVRLRHLGKNGKVPRGGHPVLHLLQRVVGVQRHDGGGKQQTG